MAPDPRVQVLINSSWIYPQRPVKLTLIFTPNDGDKEGILEGAKISMNGYYIRKVVQ